MPQPHESQKCDAAARLWEAALTCSIGRSMNYTTFMEDSWTTSVTSANAQPFEPVVLHLRMFPSYKDFY